MDDWDLNRLTWKPHHPEILSSTDEGRVIALDLPAGELLQDHQVHEGAWITVVYGEVTIANQASQAIKARSGILVRVSPQERHEVKALADSRLLLILTPWPGAGHPGAMSLEEKTDVRGRAAERAGR